MTERIGGEARTRTFASPTAYEALLRAELAVVRGDPDGALRQLELAITADPSDPYLVARRVDILLMAGNVADAHSAAAELSQQHPGFAAGWIALYRVHARRNDHAAALLAVQRAVALDPDDPDVRAAAAEVAGGSPDSVARARVGAPDARAGDRMIAARTVVRDPRTLSVTGRRSRAVDQVARGAWREVDRTLSPLIEHTPDRVFDRVRVIEARVLDGRPGDAARLVPGVRVTESSPAAEAEEDAPRRAAVARSERARLWLIAGRADVAIEEARAVLRADREDLVAKRVLGHALLLQGRFAEGVHHLNEVPLDAPGVAMIARLHDDFEGTLAPGDGDVPGEGHGAPGVAWALARVSIAEALAAAGRAALADRVLAQAVRTLSDPVTRGARERLRVARARLLVRRGDVGAARDALAEVETAWGRHRRGAILIAESVSDASLADLQVRSNDPHEDALADAWVVLACGASPRACARVDLAALEARAREWAPSAPVTLRAMAARSNDPRQASDLLRQADARDPTSPWTARIQRRRDGDARAQGP